MKALMEKAKLLESQYQLEFSVFLQDFKRNNPSNNLNRIINT
jgi:hypothetical protein